MQYSPPAPKGEYRIKLVGLWFFDRVSFGIFVISGACDDRDLPTLMIAKPARIVYVGCLRIDDHELGMSVAGVE